MNSNEVIEYLKTKGVIREIVPSNYVITSTLDSALEFYNNRHENKVEPTKEETKELSKEVSEVSSMCHPKWLPYKEHFNNSNDLFNAISFMELCEVPYTSRANLHVKLLNAESQKFIIDLLKDPEDVVIPVLIDTIKHYYRTEYPQRFSNFITSGTLLSLYFQVLRDGIAKVFPESEDIDLGDPDNYQTPMN